MIERKPNMRAYRRFGIDMNRGPQDLEVNVTPTVSPSTLPIADASVDPRQEAQAWSALLLRLVRELDRHHPACNAAAKREGLLRALCLADAEPAALRGRVATLLDSWMRPQAASVADVTATAPTLDELRRDAASAQGAVLLDASAANPEIPDKLRDLLGLVLENIAQLTPEHRLLEGQIEQIRQALAVPLTAEGLAEVELQVRRLMTKQVAIRQRVEDAKAAIKEMVAIMISRLSTMAASTGGYTERLDRYAGTIRDASDLPALSDVVRRLLDDTRNLSTDMTQARDEISFAKQRVQEHEGRVEALERELQRISALVRTDPLTEALNRRGFEEAYAMELARAERCGEPIAVGLLDLDDFKCINDQHGHKTGDMALRYLTDVMRACLRPVDAIGRYGGEEFAILMPNTSPDDAAAMMQRIQRELTRRIFLHDNQRLLVTFSAGVAAVDPANGLAEALERCDAAMYTAKRAGKNRVLVAA